MVANSCSEGKIIFFQNLINKISALYGFDESEQFHCYYLSVMSTFGTSVFNKVVR